MAVLEELQDNIEAKLKNESSLKDKKDIIVCLFCKHYKPIPGNILCSQSENFVQNDPNKCPNFELNREDATEMHKKYCYLCEHSITRHNKNSFTGLYCTLKSPHGEWISESMCSKCGYFKLYK